MDSPFHRFFCFIVGDYFGSAELLFSKTRIFWLLLRVYLMKYSLYTEGRESLFYFYQKFLEKRYNGDGKERR